MSAYISIEFHFGITLRVKLGYSCTIKIKYSNEEKTVFLNVIRFYQGKANILS